MKKEIRSFQIRAETTDDGVFVNGYAAVFDQETTIMDLFREVIRPGAFKRALAEGQDVKALINHDPNLLCGRSTSGTLQLREDSKGLRFRLKLPDTGPANDLKELLGRGDISQCSFSMQVVEDNWDADLREVLDVDLLDISIVTYPAYEGTSAQLGRSAELPASMPAELRAQLEARKVPLKKQCICHCRACMVHGDCSKCSAERCEDRDCKADGCPAQEDRAAADGCECDCPECQIGECSECTNPSCDDENCEGCPMQDRTDPVTPLDDGDEDSERMKRDLDIETAAM